ncbi:MAG: hypothetical protein AAFR38_02105 [Planctomycetota bacterium]
MSVERIEFGFEIDRPTLVEATVACYTGFERPKTGGRASDRAGRQGLVLFINLAVAAFVVGMIRYGDQVRATELVIDIVLSVLAALGVYYVWCFLATRPRAKRLAAKQMELFAEDNSIVPALLQVGRRRVVLTGDSISFESERGRMTIEWPIVVAAYRVGRIIVLRTRSGEFYWWPDSAFESPGEADEALAFGQARIRSHGGLFSFARDQFGIDPKCPSCGYDLAGIEGDLCPECGARASLDQLANAAIDGLTPKPKSFAMFRPKRARWNHSR